MPRHGSSVAPQRRTPTVRHAPLVRQAIILAAGNGDRFRHGSPRSPSRTRSKLLASVRGTPLLIRTLTAAWQAGIRVAHVVLGYDAERVRALAMRCAPPELRLHFDLNREWHEENGLSVLAAREGVAAHQPFALLMGDHLFEPRVLRRLLRTPSRSGEALLCIDRQQQSADVVAEGTRVRVDRGRVTAIGKGLDPFDAIDTGLFVCHATVFDALDEARAAGDTTLSAGIRRLAARGLVRGIDIGRARWCDIDTVADLSAAEALLA